VVEVYNLSARANAIRRYVVYELRPDGQWKSMDAEYSWDRLDSASDEEVCNRTPLTIPPYSGVEAHILAHSAIKEQKREIVLKIEIEDLYGRRFSTETKAY
jgi:hypothetical protein